MALKDWKITSNIEDWRTIYTNNKTGKRIYILWNEGFTSWRFGNYADINKTFSFSNLKKSKYKAFSFAKSYMRKH